MKRILLSIAILIILIIFFYYFESLEGFNVVTKLDSSNIVSLLNTNSNNKHVLLDNNNKIVKILTIPQNTYNSVTKLDLSNNNISFLNKMKISEIKKLLKIQQNFCQKIYSRININIINYYFN